MLLYAAVYAYLLLVIRESSDLTMDALLYAVRIPPGGDEGFAECDGCDCHDRCLKHSLSIQGQLDCSVGWTPLQNCTECEPC